MKYLFGLLALCLGSWLLTLPADALQQGFFFWRGQLVQLSGTLLIVLMAALLLMATRPRWLEQRLGGLDHLYLLHKWCGIGAAGLVLLHWLLVKSPHWLIQWGWLTPGARHAHQGASWRGLGMELGELAFYGMLLLVIISLVKALPYGRFRLIHKLGAVLGLMAGLHSLILLADGLHATPFGWLSRLACLLVLAASLWSLLGRIGRARRVTGQLAALSHPAPALVELAIRLPRSFARDYRPGQFALLTLDPREGAHPFTILCQDPDTGLTHFAIKGLGDHTRQLVQGCRVGQRVWAEGPYGRFILPDEGARPQLWIAGGIGITPFFAWLEALARQGQTRRHTRLIYCVERSEEVLHGERLRQLARKSGVALEIHTRQQQGLLDPRPLFTDAETQCWFCGPQGMGECLASALPSGRLHHERFAFR
ncbi:ferric reductase-like transmembrane domain-containing protein [Pseudaeromonas sp. ZJS20]|uniref:ferredoxin reductase family protein n=1 Tax=Pseudaeromonas aegiceratis TaxID=3153928 RepID=UPI00390CBDC5